MSLTALAGGSFTYFIASQPNTRFGDWFKDHDHSVGLIATIAAGVCLNHRYQKIRGAD
jgi:hypothetical protein